MNNVILIGNLAGDPVARTTQSGKPTSNFRIAVQRRFSNQNGERETDFFNVVAFGKTADFVNSYMVKGRKVAVEGSVQNRSYAAQDGSTRYVTEIVADQVEALGSPSGSASGAQSQETAQPQANNVRNEQQRMDYTGDQFAEVDDPDLPF